MKPIAFALAVSLAGLSGHAMAGDSYSYTCTHMNDTRIVEVLYLQRESPVPCEVRYTKKDSQGNTISEDTLWSAGYSVGFCEQKAEEFIQKQEDWGWSCTGKELMRPVDESDIPEPV